MAEHIVKNLSEPDQTIRMPGIAADLVTVGDATVGREVDEPGWRWSSDMRPLVGGEWCESHHVGVLLSGRSGFLLRDGTTFEIGPNDVFDIPPGHDSWTIGDEPAVYIEWSGLRTWVRTATSFSDRVLTTLLMSDVVQSTTTLSRIGDTAWRELLGAILSVARELLALDHGRLVDTTGDGLFATFDSPVRALHFADALRQAAHARGVAIRTGVHTGEVELAGTGVRGLAVHETARIMSAAGADDILVSEATRTLAAAGGATFTERGGHDLKGLHGVRSLYEYSGAPG